MRMNSPTSNNNALSFIGVGARRSATTWIYNCLYDHPEICMPMKAIHFFNKEESWTRGFAWYENHFRDCGAKPVRGEYTPGYLTCAEAPARIASRYPAVKLIFCFRNPLERMVSQYYEDIRCGRVDKNLPFLQALKSHPEYIDQSLYAKHLNRFLSRFPKSQILCLFYQDLTANPRAFVQQIYRFLGVAEHHMPSLLRQKLNPSRIPLSTALEEGMTHMVWFLQRRGLDRWVWRIRKTGLPDLLRKFNAVQSKREDDLPPSDAERIYARYFAQDIKELERLCDRSITAWEPDKAT